MGSPSAWDETTLKPTEIDFLSNYEDFGDVILEYEVMKFQ